MKNYVINVVVLLAMTVLLILDVIFTYIAYLLTAKQKHMNHILNAGSRFGFTQKKGENLMEIKVDYIDVPRGITCGRDSTFYCQFVNDKEERCVLFNEALTKENRKVHYNKCESCLKACEESENEN